MSTTAKAATFRALGTDVEVATEPVTPSAVDTARAVLVEVDEACSRFRSDSDLSRANARAGSTVTVSPLLAAAVRVAIEAAHDTDGLVDPCLGRQLVALGYDADIAEVQARGPHATFAPLLALPSARWRELEVDETSVLVPSGVTLDLGATAKAFAADLVALTIADEHHVDVAVSVGGDVRVVGSTPWPVVVDDGTDHEAGTVIIGDGGIATSSTSRRRWTQAGIQRHHLLDPRTGLPCDSPWRTISATGPTCVAANTATTAAIVLGGDAIAWLTARGVAARLVDHYGQAQITPGWPS